MKQSNRDKDEHSQPQYITKQRIRTPAIDKADSIVLVAAPTVRNTELMAINEVNVNKNKMKNAPGSLFKLAKK